MSAGLSDIYIRIHENSVNRILKNNFGSIAGIIRGEVSPFQWDLTCSEAGYPSVRFESKTNPADDAFYFKFGLRISYQPKGGSSGTTGDIFLVGCWIRLIWIPGKLSLELKEKPELIKSYSRDPASEDLFNEFLKISVPYINESLKKLQIPDLNFGIPMHAPTICFFDCGLFYLRTLTERYFSLPDRFSNKAIDIRLTPALLGEVLKKNIGSSKEIKIPEVSNYIKSLKINFDWGSLKCSQSSISLKIDVTGLVTLGDLTCVVQTNESFIVRFGIQIHNEGDKHEICINYQSSDPVSLKLLPIPQSLKAAFESIFLILFTKMSSINLDAISYIKDELCKKEFPIGLIPNVALSLGGGKKLQTNPVLSTELSNQSVILKGDINININ